MSCLPCLAAVVGTAVDSPRVGLHAVERDLSPAAWAISLRLNLASELVIVVTNQSVLSRFSPLGIPPVLLVRTQPPSTVPSDSQCGASLLERALVALLQDCVGEDDTDTHTQHTHTP